MPAKKFTKKIKGILIDPLILTFKFYCECNGKCCHHGVYTDKKEFDTILELRDEIRKLMDNTQSKDISEWFEAPEEDEEFESGIAVGTEVINGKCTFLDKKGFCVLQKYADKKGEYKWKYKPLYCILFPLTIYEGALTVDDEHMERADMCNEYDGEKIPIYKFCREEIEHLLGKDGYKELEEYKKEYFRKKKIKDKNETEG